MTALAVAHLTPAGVIDGWVAGCATCERRSDLFPHLALSPAALRDRVVRGRLPLHEQFVQLGRRVRHRVTLARLRPMVGDFA